MAKKSIGLRFNERNVQFTQRTIALDNNNVPWVIDPEAGTIQLATLVVEENKKSAVKKRK